MSKKMPEMPRLVATASDLVKVMKLKPPINTKVPPGNLVASITAAAKEIRAGDAFQKDTLAVLTELGLNLNGAVEAAEAAAPAPAPAPAAPKAPKAPAAPKAPRVTRLAAATRVLKGLKKAGMTRAEVVTAADAVYVKAGGKASEKETGDDVRRALAVLTELAMVVVDGDTIRPAPAA